MTELSVFLVAHSKGDALVSERDGATFLVAVRPERSPRLLVGMRLVQHQIGGPWEMVEAGVVAIDGTLAPEDLRQPYGDLLARARERITSATHPRAARGLRIRSPSEVDLAEFTTGRRGVAIPDAAYARLALHYVLSVQAGERAPAKRLSEHLGHGSAAQWRQRIAEARRRGLLTEPRSGESGGRLTPSAERLLGADGQADDDR